MNYASAIFSSSRALQFRDIDEYWFSRVSGGAISEVYLTDGVAKERAIDAEESYLVEQLVNASCLTGWGTSETTAQTTATVAERTAEGVVVEVTHAYWYSTDFVEADGASEARYVVTENEARRIQGDTISPC